MSALAIFGFCVAIAIALVILVLLVLGPGAMLLVVIFPAMIAEAITGERGMFSPNGGSPKSLLFNFLLFLGVVIQLLLVGGVFFGIYCLFFGWPASVVATHLDPTSLNISELGSLLLINKILMAITAYFMIMFSYNSYKYRDAFKQMLGLSFIINRILPVLSFPLVIVYLVASHNFLTNYPDETRQSTLVNVCGTLYLLYLLFSLGRTIYFWSLTLRSGFSQLKSSYWFGLGLSLVFDGLFFYFFFQL